MGVGLEIMKTLYPKTNKTKKVVNDFPLEVNDIAAVNVSLKEACLFSCQQLD